MDEWKDALAAFCMTGAHLSTLQPGWTNSSVRARTACADIVLRRHGGLGITRASVERKLRIAAMLHGRGAPVSRPVAAVDGRLAIRSAGHIYSASQYARGSVRAGASAHFYGAFLGSYHAVALGAPRANAPALASRAVFGWLASEFHTMHRARRAGIDWRHASDIARILNQSCKAERSRGAMLWVHGDARAENIVTSGTRATLIDFDFLHYSEPVYDLATLADDIAWPAGGTLADSIVEQLLLGYATQVAFTDQQRSALLPAMARRNLAMLWYIAARHPVLAGIPLANARHCLHRCERLLERIA